MQLLHSSTVYPPTALHSLLCGYVLWFASFAQTFLGLLRVFSAGSHISLKLSLLPTSFSPETLHTAPRPGTRSLHPPTPLLVLDGRAEAGKELQLELEIPPHASDSLAHPPLGQGHHTLPGLSFWGGSYTMHGLVSVQYHSPSFW